MKKLLEVISAARRGARQDDSPGVSTGEWRP
jgi:hypothetical protein